MKRTSKVLVAILILGCGTLASLGKVNAKANAAASEPILEDDDNAIDKLWSKKLAKAGYVFKLNETYLYRDDSEDRISYSLEDAQKIKNQNMLFKIDEVKSVNNGSAIHLISKNGEYHFWTNFLTGVNNVNAQKAALQPLINAELKAIRAEDSQTASIQFDKANQLASKLQGKNKELAFESLQQLKQWLKDKRFANLPTLLLGSI